jgi:hypothetical protein
MKRLAEMIIWNYRIHSSISVEDRAFQCQKFLTNTPSSVFIILIPNRQSALSFVGMPSPASAPILNFTYQVSFGCEMEQLVRNLRARHELISILCKMSVVKAACSSVICVTPYRGVLGVKLIVA